MRTSRVPSSGLLRSLDEKRTCSNDTMKTNHPHIDPVDILDMDQGDHIWIKQARRTWRIKHLYIYIYSIYTYLKYLI